MAVSRRAAGSELWVISAALRRCARAIGRRRKRDGGTDSKPLSEITKARCINARARGNRCAAIELESCRLWSVARRLTKRRFASGRSGACGSLTEWKGWAQRCNLWFGCTGGGGVSSPGPTRPSCWRPGLRIPMLDRKVRSLLKRVDVPERYSLCDLRPFGKCTKGIGPLSAVAHPTRPV